ncbi:LysE family translocator [Aestuariirhabdus sp. LZHN29]|uniref:LysE family translocator n=1 Tax=Aestuariirhabdus sp. LZHN29 TaxID=3417462 RepID=UPI003CEAEEE5
MTVFISMFIFALIGAISPGPVNIIATGAGANFGFLRTVPHVLGATLAYTLIVFMTGIGLNEVLEAYPRLATNLQYPGGVFLLYMSYKIATSKPLTDDNWAENNPPSLLQGVLSQGLNPKAWLVSMSGVSLFVVTNSPATLYLLIFCLISFVVCFIGIGTWAAFGHLIRNVLAKESHHVLFNVLMGLLLSTTVIIMFMNP